MFFHFSTKNVIKDIDLNNRKNQNSKYGEIQNASNAELYIQQLIKGRNNLRAVKSFLARETRLSDRGLKR